MKKLLFLLSIFLIYNISFANVLTDEYWILKNYNKNNWWMTSNKVGSTIFIKSYDYNKNKKIMNRSILMISLTKDPHYKNENYFLNYLLSIQKNKKISLENYIVKRKNKLCRYVLNSEKIINFDHKLGIINNYKGVVETILIKGSYQHIQIVESYFIKGKEKDLVYIITIIYQYKKGNNNILKKMKLDMTHLLSNLELKKY